MFKKENKKWFCRFVGDFYAIEFFGCVNEKDARAEARKWLGVNRLPNGTEFWCNSEEISYDC